MRDPYETLGVRRSASQEEIKKAYRRLVKELHPDVNPGDTSVERRFKDVSAAYDILGDKEKRARFDRGEIDAEGRDRHDAFYRAYSEAAGARARRRGPAGGPGVGPGAAAGRTGPGGFSAQDIFDDLFGRGGFKSKGADVSYTLLVGLVDAALGTRRRMTLSDGRSVEVTVPPGTEDGQTLRLKGQGLPGMGGGTPGDAFIEIHVEPHPFFTRKDGDIHVEVPVTLQEAVLGASIEVPTIDGKVSVKIPRGANSGTSLRLRGKGVAHGPHGQRGDQYIKLKIVLPDPPDPELTEFINRWKPRGAYDPRKKAGLT